MCLSHGFTCTQHNKSQFKDTLTVSVPNPVLLMVHATKKYLKRTVQRSGLGP